MLEQFGKRLLGWLHKTKPRVASSPKRLSALRPLERLESRDVLANNTWMNLGTSYDVPANWSDGIPTPDDVLIFAPRRDPVAQGGGELGAPPPALPPGVSTSVTFPNAQLNFAGIQINHDYTGTITFQDHIWFDKYNQAGGVVAQEAGTVQAPLNLAVVIKNQFNWTGGDIYGPGTYYLQGADGRIGLDNTTLTAGVTFALNSIPVPGVGGAMDDCWIYQSGTLNIAAPIYISGDSIMSQARVNPAGARPVISSQVGLGGNPGIILMNSAAFQGIGGAVPSVLLSGGGLLVISDGGLEVTGETTGGYGVKMTGNARLNFKNGETLKATNGVWMDGGKLTSDFNLAALQRATIDGVFKMTGGTVELGQNPDLGHVGYTELHVKGVAKLHGGTFKTKVDENNKDNRDAIVSGDKLDTLAAFTVQPLGVGPAVGTHVLDSLNGFTNDSVDPTNANGNAWVMERSQDGKQWLVKKKP
jgi:hypothetical protein